MEKRALFRRAVKATLPVMAGYLVLGIGFGVLMHSRGLGLGWTALMSIFIYAGSMQYVGVELLTTGAGLLSTALMTLMINARHLFYGISMLERYRNLALKKLYMIFGLTDESFSVNCVTDPPAGVDRSWFMFFVTLLDHGYWVTGCTLGGLFGALVRFNTEGLDFVMTAMFVVIFLEQWKKDRNHLSAILGLALPIACLLVFGADGFMIPAMLAILAGLELVRKPLEKEAAV